MFIFGEENIFKEEMPIGDFMRKATITKDFHQNIEGKRVNFRVEIKIRQALNKKERTTITV